MCIEIDSIGADDQYLKWDTSFSSAENDLQKNIFDQCNHFSAFTKNVSHRIKLDNTDQKMQKVSFAKDVNVSGKAEINIEWGGSNGTSFNGSVSGNISDQKGNKAEASIKIDDDGAGKISASVSHDDKSNKSGH